MTIFECDCGHICPFVLLEVKQLSHQVCKVVNTYGFIASIYYGVELQLTLLSKKNLN